MYKQKIRVILKSGSEFVITCDSFEGEKDRGTGELLSYFCEGITENRPLYLDLKQVAAILQEDVSPKQEEGL